MFFPWAVRVWAEIAAASMVPGDAVSLSDPSPVFITCLLEAVLPQGAQGDLESLDYTCSLVAIIRRMTQHVSMGKDGALFKSTIMDLDGEHLAVLNGYERADMIR